MSQATVPTRSAETAHEARAAPLLRYLVVGTLFGVILTKSEVLSWYRIHEMFHFDGFHMYGVLGSAILTAALSVRLLRRSSMRTLGGEPLVFPRKEPRRYSYIIGGTIFGVGWGLTGACPGPISALIGAGYTVIVVVLLSAVLGTLVYGLLRLRLPH